MPRRPVLRAEGFKRATGLVPPEKITQNFTGFGYETVCPPFSAVTQPTRVGSVYAADGRVLPIFATAELGRTLTAFSMELRIVAIMPYQTATKSLVCCYAVGAAVYGSFYAGR